MKIIHILAHKSYWGVLIAALLTFAACGSSRKAIKGQDADTTTSATNAADKLTRTVVEKVEANSQTVKGLRAKANVSLGGLSASGPLKMKRDEIIQLSLSALLGLMEVGRVEMTPDYFFYLDRINHEYVKVQWEAVPQLREAGITFDTFQALFWNELFVPGKPGTVEPADFETEQAGNAVRLKVKAKGNAQYALAVSFLVETSKGLIQQTSVSPAKTSSLSLVWTCSEWTSVEGKSFPSDMLMRASSGTDATTLSFKLSNVQVDEHIGNIASPMPGNNYKPIDIQKLFRQLSK